jgi:hypothetical protein
MKCNALAARRSCERPARRAEYSARRREKPRQCGVHAGSGTVFDRNSSGAIARALGMRRALLQVEPEDAMKKAIAIGILGLAFASNRAAAQTAVERAQILRDFQQSVVDYMEQQERLVMFPEAPFAVPPAPRMFTLPVAMVFRQIIAEAVTSHHSPDWPAVAAALPALPATLQYRLNGGDLEVRNTEDGEVVGVLKDAFSAVAARR